MSADFVFHLGQVARLNEIQGARQKRGLPGIGRDVQELIERLQAESASVTMRYQQAKVLWNLWRARGACSPFDKYLKLVPPLPVWPAQYVSHFDSTCLVDTRVPIRVACELAGIDIDLSDDNHQLVHHQPARMPDVPVYWMNCQDGDNNRCKSVLACREVFAPFEVGLTVLEGIALSIQHRGILLHHNIVLPGTECCSNPDQVAVLANSPSGRPVLRTCSIRRCDYKHGAASRGDIITA